MTSTYADLTSADTRAEARRLAALSNPATMGRFLDPPAFLARAHTRLIGQELNHLGKDYDRLLLTTPPQVGKPVYVDAMILMGDGSRKPLKDVTVGDTVITHEGRARRVTAVHEQGEQECVRITTDGGRETTAALDHPFLTPDGWVNAGDLQAGISLATVPRPDTGAPGALTEDEGYLLGAFVGDGSVTGTSVLITCFSDGMVTRLQNCADQLGFVMALADSPSQKGRRAYRFRAQSRTRAHQEAGVRPWLARHGVAGKNSHTKRVPADIFTAAPSTIAAFIAGYWDCDGSVSYRGKGREGKPRTDVSMELNSVSRELLADVQHLLLRLGIRSKIRVKKGAYKDTEHISYRLQIIARDDVAKFRALIPLAHEVKAKRLREHPLPRTDFDGPLLPDPITSVERIGLRECRCLTVEEDHTFTSDDLVVHNSTLVSELLPFWWLARHPTTRSAIASYAATLALKKSRAVRRHVMESGAQYGLHIQRGESNVHDWSVTAGGGLRATGVGGSLTGFPITGVGIVDDPHKDRRDADSLRMRNHVWEWWSSVMLSRLRPGVPLVLVMTRWHEDDLAGRVLRHEGVLEKGGRWKVLHLPAVAVSPSDPLGRPIGAPLTHPALDDSDTSALAAHWADKRATSTPRDWGALYQGDPQPAEGALVTRDQLADQRRLNGHPAVPQPERIAVAVDPSGGGRDVAGIIGGFRGTDQRLYITHDRSRACSSAQWSRRACLLAFEIGATVIHVERNYGGDMVNMAIATAWDALKKEGAIPKDALKPYIAPVIAKTGKYLRAEPIAQQWIEDRIRTTAYLPEMEEEWATWQPDHTDSPGRIDASTYLAYGLLKIPGASQHLGNAANVSISQAAQQGGGFSSIPLGRGGPGLPGGGGR